MPQPPSTPVCPKREPLADGHCKHQLPTGCCALPDELTCVEWVSSRQPTQKSLPGVPAPAPKPVVAAPKPRPSPTSVPAAEPSSGIDLSRLRGFTTEDIDSFKALGVEVCLQSDSFGELWLVPAYTGQPRRELTPEHLATVLHALSVFPGSRVTAFHPPIKPGPARQEKP